MIDWENYSTIGVGRPQELITQQTLEKFKGSLALVVGLMAQRFGSPGGKADSGTEEEFQWAKQTHDATGFPEIKWFFRKIEKLELPADPDETDKALDQWKKVRAFRQRMQDLHDPIFYTEYPSANDFGRVFDHDLNLWLADPARPWAIVPSNPRRGSERSLPVVTRLRPVSHREAWVSYAWKEEQSTVPARAGKVVEFCTRLAKSGLSIVRDSQSLELGDRLTEFMRRLGNSDRIYIFLSDAYLKSPNCMYELLHIWESSGDDPEQFRRRTRVFTMPGTNISSIADRLRYARYWREQRDELQNLIRDNVDVLGPTDLKQWQRLQQFALQVTEMLAQIQDVLQAGDLDQFIAGAITELGTSTPTDSNNATT